MGKLTRHIQRSLPTKISLKMFFVAVLVFVLVNSVFMVISRQHFHSVAMDNASEALNTAVARAERFLKPAETVADTTNRMELSKALSSIKPYPHSYIIILDQNGRYYVHPDSTKMLNKTIFDLTNGRYYPDKLALGYEMTAGHSGRMHADVAGVTCLICYQPVSGTNWSVALISQERDVLHGSRRLIISILVIIFIGLVIIYAVCRRTVVRAFAPVKLLEEQTQRIADGDYSTVIARSNENSVVGNLQNSFADMQETLSRHVRNLNSAIEESARRNDEIQKANSALEEAIRRQGVFVANMTHQIRTPLNLIMGFSQLLREAGEGMSADEKQALLHVIDYHTFTLCRMSLMLYDSSDLSLILSIHHH